jgi:DDE superfamily endonuclease
MLLIFSSNPFYANHVHLPVVGDPPPPEIAKNPKFWPYFKDAVGALDGSHIHSAPPVDERSAHRNRKGFVSQNCLFGCDFNFRFVFVYTGWEGSATDALVYEGALRDGFTIPEGKYYLADAGFPICEELLIPYRSTRYHLAEWGRANVRYAFAFVTLFIIHCSYRPANKEELFNLRHSSARNVIERIFGVLKGRYRILRLAPEYELEIQARIPAALCCLHNFIRTYDDQPDQGEDFVEPDRNNNNNLNAEAAQPGPDEPNARRDQIAQQMWDDYVAILRDREVQEDEGSGDEDQDLEDSDEFEDDDD